jgi:hypothetical protein
LAPTSINFTGAGVTATASGDDVTVDIPGVAGITGGALTLISEQTPSGTGTVSFTSIPGTYRDLMLVIRGRGTNASTFVTAKLTFNNDTGSNYDRQRLQATNASVAASALAAQTSIDIADIAAANAPTSAADVSTIEIADYRGTTFQKAVKATSSVKTNAAATGWAADVRVGWWRSTAAITRVDLVLTAGNFVAGSVVSLYGRA